VCDRRGCDGLLTSGVGQWREVVPASVSIAGVRLWFDSHSAHVADITYVRLLSGERKRVDGTIY